MGRIIYRIIPSFNIEEFKYANSRVIYNIYKCQFPVMAIIYVCQFHLMTMFS